MPCKDLSCGVLVIIFKKPRRSKCPAYLPLLPPPYNFCALGGSVLDPNMQMKKRGVFTKQLQVPVLLVTLDWFKRYRGLLCQRYRARRCWQSGAKCERYD